MKLIWRRGRKSEILLLSNSLTLTRSPVYGGRAMSPVTTLSDVFLQDDEIYSTLISPFRVHTIFSLNVFTTGAGPKVRVPDRK